LDFIAFVGIASWSFNPGVGMIWISFPGITQMFVAGANPPHLAAVAPFSVIGDIYRGPGFPGGIFNNGFGQTWLQERKDDAEPAPEGGQQWAIDRVNNGDTTCLANQNLRLQTQDPVDFTYSNPYYTPSLMDQRSPINWVSNIDVPTFVSGAWQDEQTGSGFVSMLRELPRRRDVKMMLINGVHSSPLEPEGLWQWIAFLDIYIGNRVPAPDRLAPFADAIYDEILGPDAPTPPLPPNPWQFVPGVDAAREIFEAEPRVRVLMENGAGSSTAGLPAATFELGFRKWPPPRTRKTSYYLGPNGTLTRARPSEDGIDSYNPDPEARPMQTLPGQGQSESWEVMPAYDWQPLVDGTAVAYTTAPLEENVTIVGPSSLDLWLRSSAADTDIQVTLTEVRPDGFEAYVQSGWLRASHRRLAPGKDLPLEPRQTHLEADAEPMPAGQFVKLRVGLLAVAHVFRAGSRIRISVEAPGGDRTRWAFDTFDTDGLVVNDVAHSPSMASRLRLPVIPRVEVPAAYPPCPGLRGQPCRTYVPAANGG
jgi:predicted acyl esterase